MDLVASGHYPDLRSNHDERAKVDGGTIYRKGSHIQAWWGEDKNENWKLTENNWGVTESKDNFRKMKERWGNPVEDIIALIRTYSEKQPDATFGEIVSCVCGLAAPRDVSNEFFIHWLSRNLPNA